MFLFFEQRTGSLPSSELNSDDRKMDTMLIRCLSSLKLQMKAFPHYSHGLESIREVI